LCAVDGILINQNSAYTCRMFSLIKELTELNAPCGQEQAITQRMGALWRDAGLKTTRDALGNVLAELGGKGRTLLLAAHGDELTFLVRDIHPDGFLWLANGQAWMRTWSQRNAFTLGQRVTVLARAGDIDGFIGSTTGHIANMALPEPHDLTWNDFWVETGLTRAQLLAQGVHPGTRVVWRAQTLQRGRLITGKALDDRASLAVLTELARSVTRKQARWQVTLACTVQEEVGAVGAAAIAAQRKFDAAVVVEIGLASDIPSIASHALPVQLGAGPALIHKDSAVHYDYALTQQMEQTANRANIALQHGVLSSFSSDGNSFMRAGIPSAMLTFPARYTHTPFETAHLDDLEAMRDALIAFVTGA
jgi:putative aminopeptidase FrvX